MNIYIHLYINIPDLALINHKKAPLWKDRICQTDCRIWQLEVALTRVWDICFFKVWRLGKETIRLERWFLFLLNPLSNLPIRLLYPVSFVQWHVSLCPRGKSQAQAQGGRVCPTSRPCRPQSDGSWFERMYEELGWSEGERSSWHVCFWRVGSSSCQRKVWREWRWEDYICELGHHLHTSHGSTWEDNSRWPRPSTCRLGSGSVIFGSIQHGWDSTCSIQSIHSFLRSCSQTWSSRPRWWREWWWRSSDWNQPHRETQQEEPVFCWHGFRGFGWNCWHNHLPILVS